MMRDLRELAAYAFEHPQFGPPDREGLGGCYMLPSPRTGVKLRIIASNDAGWDHVSVSLEHRCPNWHEMELVKHTFFREGEWAMQLHAPPSEHINIHPHVLHIWRPHEGQIPIPPAIFV